MEAQPMAKKEKQRLYNKKYREANRELILAVKAEYRKIICQCSCEENTIRNNLSRHLKSKKHLRLLQEQQKEVVKPDDVVDTEEEALQTEPVEEPLLEITEEEMSLLHRLLALFRR